LASREAAKGPVGRPSGQNGGIHLFRNNTDSKNPAVNSTMMKTQKSIECIICIGLNPMDAAPIPLFLVIHLAQITRAIGATTHPTRTVPSPIKTLLK